MKIKILAILAWLMLTVFECKKETPLPTPKIRNPILDSTKNINLNSDTISKNTIAL